LRVSAIALLAWGLFNLYTLEARTKRPKNIPEGGYRHLIIVLDVSPSMQLRDAGPAGQQTRMQRAGELLMSMLNRVVLEQARVSIIAFYTGAKPVVVDTYDLDVVKNILTDLPMDYAFNHGKTMLMDGIREAAALSKPWKKGSTTIIVVSDGDTIQDSGMTAMPPSVAQVLVAGVGDARVGRFIDGHQSRQDSSTLRQLAGRLRGYYHDGNEKHLPSAKLSELAKALPMHSEAQKGRREFALAAVSVGATILGLIPLTLALGAAPWQSGRQVRKPAWSQDSIGKCMESRLQPVAHDKIQARDG
jgi:Ca-activated chloride channel family protein